ncbi:MAG: glycoside hydrolase family 15 protein [Cellulomonas sp.]
MTHSREPVPPHVLRDYALIADGERGALVGPHGDYAWMCAPSWHDEPVFAGLVGGAGVYAVTPTDDRHVWGGFYEDGSLIWRSRWVTTTSIIECREALAFPGDPSRAVLLRRVVAVAGRASVRVRLDVRSGFDGKPMTGLGHADGTWTGHSGDLAFRWRGGDRAHRHEGLLEAVIELEQGTHHDLVLELGAGRFAGAPLDPDRLWVATEQAWAESAPSMDSTIAPDDARQSYAVLRGMTSHTGAMVAAATMSLPERAEHGSNYDYRYAWIRDQCYTGQSVGAVGPLPLLDDAVRFVSARILADGSSLSPGYRIDGSPIPHEQTIDLPGYPGAGVRSGNWVNDQFQLDALGESLLLFTAAARHDHLDLDHWQAVETVADVISHRWHEPDSGIWELAPQRWAHSRLTCAAGLRAIAAYAPARQGAQWVALADTLVTDTAADCLHPDGRWQRAPGDPRVDAALLLPGLRGALPADDPRSTATLAAVRTELSSDGYVYRFRHDARPLHETEGAFVLCGFHMAMATHQEGHEKEALRWFERNRSACGSPGLFTEEYDVEQRQQRGNLPQAFVHSSMIEAAQVLADPPRKAHS